ncbi:hypothetical protein AJ79_08720 [Helicocarpus griseus UAMH5409]|uniref:Peptidase C13 family protein n=1 Tax=Helicocarpus griseus UAMH5409 TaxID=1447875 RepID=A0A2B7WRA9_9EURO|nr:hypothetical protein AJ79_08720 [Helicocarpus griseus UAMH5409]
MKDRDTICSSNQLWFTCVELRTLVLKYKEYVHASRSGDHRVVPDKTLLDGIEARKNILVIPSKDLLERFLATLRSETQLAAKEDQPVRVFIFGHGEQGNYGFAIGGEGSVDSAPKLTLQKFNSAIYTGVDVSLFTTSCYSGGWAIKPMRGSSLSPANKLNISRTTAVNEEETSREWACSQSCGRARRSIYRSSGDNDVGASIQDIADRIRGMEFSDQAKRANTVSSSLSVETPVTVLSDLRDICSKSLIALSDIRNMTLSTIRTGFHFLPKMANGEVGRAARSPVGKTNNEIATPDLTSPLGFTGNIGPGYHNVVRVKARAYMESFPGPDNVGVNGVHSKLKQLLGGKKYDEEILIELNDTLDYRLSSMPLASQYVTFLDLQFPDGLMFDTEAWCNDLCLKIGQNDDDSTAAKAKLDKFMEVRRYTAKANLFDSPLDTQGYYYLKPKEYLAIALVESSGLSIDEIRDTSRMERKRFLTQMPLAQEMMENEKVARHRDRFYETLKDKGWVWPVI